MNKLVQSVCPREILGIVGVFVEQDLKAPDDLSKEGKLAFDWGKLWKKGQRMGTGQTNVKACDRGLRELIAAGQAKPSCIIVSHELPLSCAPEAYMHFDKRYEGWTKVVPKPGA